MPLYEYRCSACRHLFDLLRPLSHVDVTATCPNCGEATAQRIISLCAVVTEQSAYRSGTPAASHGCACGGACACTSRA